MYIRNKLRLLGDFCGTLPKHIAQNQYLSLPLVLSYEETVFGVMKGYFAVVSDDECDYRPVEGAAEAFWKAREEDVERQVDESVRQNVAERERRKGGGLQGVRGGRKRRHEEAMEQTEEEDGPLRKVARTVWRWIGERLGWGATATAEATIEATAEAMGRDGDDNDDNDDNYGEEKNKEKEEGVRQRLQTQARATAMVITSTAGRTDEGAQRVRRRVWQPSGREQRRLRERLAVLEDLHERGYFVSCGAKFGADVLAYAGPPHIFHAALAVVVLSGAQRVDARAIVAMGRLGDATRKRAVAAFVRAGRVRYVGVQWEETLP
ncbi:unnamed protein product [Agarophyton chilense]